jgi:hypothetical protein
MGVIIQLGSDGIAEAGLSAKSSLNVPHAKRTSVLAPHIPKNGHAMGGFPKENRFVLNRYGLAAAIVSLELHRDRHQT